MHNLPGLKRFSEINFQSFLQNSGKTAAERFIEMLENTVESKLSSPPDKDSPTSGSLSRKFG
jgi:hypothetical protein